MVKLLIVVSLLVVALYASEGEAVRCWTCSSDMNPYCNDPYILGRGGENTGLFRLEYCDSNAGATYPYLSTSKSVCKKQKKYVGDQLIVSRGCTWKRQDDYSNNCASSSNGPNEVTLFCETCDYDGCNGASAITMTLALIMAPLGVLLFK
ncbi:uncharacterized protein LOC123660509 [Melitaea cinxia]|uniref:uncharacterized protein LOC123660509 n=1 Tax=Melitaea cinxia TaxID=113334 RepID=UPI001E273A95|nr:uncharacterized protein LOC123660509 [Melitaea cinxia]